jgi:hypothetical protein
MNFPPLGEEKKTGEKRRYLPTSGTLPRTLLWVYVVLHRERGFYSWKLGGVFLG